MTRLVILKASLEKKEALFDSKLAAHFSSVKEANGQPLNDKRNGRATMGKWGRQNDALHALKESIQKTKDAIDKEEGKIARVECANDLTPPEILQLIADGTLKQWRKHPTTFFVDGVDKARIVWDVDKRILAHRYVSQIPDREQHKKFAVIFNVLSKQIKEAAATAQESKP